MAATMTYHVTGMTCHHCAGAVAGALGEAGDYCLAAK